MNFRLLHRIFAAAVFVISLIVYIATVQPSVSFWDCGEFIAAGYYLQVPHPPGTPFFLLLGNIFSKIPFIDNVGLKVNLISVFSSAFAVLIAYLVAVKIIKNYKGGEYKNKLDAVATFTSAAIGALAFAFSDTFWFNAVEAEVYALSTLLFGLIVYLIMRWNERADEQDNEKYILMIAYLVGISTGVHLMSVLAIVPVVMIIVFRKYLQDEEHLKKTAFIFMLHAGIILLLAVFWWMGETNASAPSPEQYQEFDSKFKWVILALSALIVGVYWKKLFSRDVLRNSFYTPLIIGGIALFVTYPGVVKFLPAVMTEVAGNDVFFEIILFILILAGVAYGIKYAIDRKKPTLHLAFMSFLFVLIGFTTFAMVIIRANQDPPMNENDPDRFTELVSYLNREQYGDFPTFKRRFTSEPHQQGVYTNYDSDLDFFYTYQMNHMMTRYLLWNFAGREGWAQDDGPNIAPFNDLGDIFGSLVGIDFEGTAADSLFGIPFLIGLFGVIHHFRRDWKMASVFLIMFILMGYLTAFYQNQQQPQPRERDYFYVGAFFVYGLWIALGVRGLFELAQEKLNRDSVKNAVSIGILAVLFVLVPFRMVQANYFTHDRSGNWVPWDYSYNLLQSCAPNAVLFTNGDNDTFPLWYLQDVEGVRRDVKIANLSLLNTPWYIKQLKDIDPYDVGTVNLNLTDTQIEQLRPIQFQPQQVNINAPGTSNKNFESMKDIYQEFNISDSTVMQKGQISWTMPATLNFGNVQAIRVQDIMVKEIIEANNWERPIYFAVTCADDSKIGLSDYLKMEGMAFRLVPEKRSQQSEFVNPEILAAQLVENPSYSKEYQPGFKFRGLNNPDIFFDNNHKRMVQNYRNCYLRLTLHYIGKNQMAEAVSTLDDMEDTLPRDIIGIDYGLLFEIGNLYNRAGAVAQFEEIAGEVEAEALRRLEEDPSDVSSYYNPYRILLDLYEMQERHDKSLEMWQRLETMYPNDPNVKTNIQKYQLLLQGKPDTLEQ